MVTLNPYLNFRDNAREAMEFYHSVFGGELTSSTFADFGQADDPADADKIMHSQLEAENGLVLMGADTPSSMPDPGSSGPISVSLSGDAGDDATLRGYWQKLLDSGSEIVPLEVAPWGDAFGMCTDRYGITWLVNIGGPEGTPVE
ncbi:VOC family protein [Agromyces subbeticus]|uniref:VOC family protein n=1 Tax=Agromyces subbeticus TaxID=293890 RepID=UPI0003B4AC7E